MKARAVALKSRPVGMPKTDDFEIIDGCSPDGLCRINLPIKARIYILLLQRLGPCVQFLPTQLRIGVTEVADLDLAIPVVISNRLSRCDSRIQDDQ